MKNVTALGRYGTIGLELVITLCLGIFGGQWLDKRWGTSYMVWVGLFVGGYAGFRAVFKAARDAQRAIEKEDREEPGKYRPLEEVDDDYDASDWKSNGDWKDPNEELPERGADGEGQTTRDSSKPQ